jgi:hypothetical protein
MGIEERDDRSSSSLWVIPAGSRLPRISRIAAAPRLPGWRARSCGSETLSVSCFTSASWKARSTSRFDATAARSKIVRKIDVAGIPSTSSTSSADSRAW